MSSFLPFCYRAIVKKMDWKSGQLVAQGAIHDGDSGWFFLDCGMHGFLNANCRLFGVNAYELNDTDPAKRQKAVAGRTWLREKIEGKNVFVRSKGLEKYGRPLLIVWMSEEDFGNGGKSINKELLDAELAVPFMGDVTAS